jgi:Lrp/AsnC family transcriptional regulator, leucine-responsive regulatory protein
MVDSIDVKILNELSKDSRVSYAEIGRSIQLSASAVRERILKLEETGVIKKYQIEINQKALGFDLEAIILIKVFHGKLPQFLSKIEQFPEIKSAYRITGNHNVHLNVLLKNQLELQNLIDRLMLYGDTQTLLILSKVI